MTTFFEEDQGFVMQEWDSFMGLMADSSDFDALFDDPLEGAMSQDSWDSEVLPEEMRLPETTTELTPAPEEKIDATEGPAMEEEIDAIFRAPKAPPRKPRLPTEEEYEEMVYERDIEIQAMQAEEHARRLKSLYPSARKRQKQPAANRLYKINCYGDLMETSGNVLHIQVYWKPNMFLKDPLSNAVFPVASGDIGGFYMCWTNSYELLEVMLESSHHEAIRAHIARLPRTEGNGEAMRQRALGMLGEE